MSMALPVEAIVQPVVDQLDSGAFEIYVPEWFQEIVAGKVADPDGFQQGTIEYLRSRGARWSGASALSGFSAYAAASRSLMLLAAAGGDPRRFAPGRAFERLDVVRAESVRALHDDRLVGRRRRERDVVEPVRLRAAVTGVERRPFSAASADTRTNRPATPPRRAPGAASRERHREHADRRRREHETGANAGRFCDENDRTGSSTRAERSFAAAGRTDQQRAHEQLRDLPVDRLGRAFHLVVACPFVSCRRRRAHHGAYWPVPNAASTWDSGTGRSARG
jgi:hypothetical protein